MAKRKQQHLPTMEPPVVPAIDAAAQRYAEVRDKRMKLTTQEVECQDEVLKLMKEKGLTEYEHEDIVVKISTTEKAKVRIGKGDEDEQ